MSGAKGSAKRRKAVDAWWCVPCQIGDMSHRQMMWHLRAKHGMETKGMMSKMRMLSHIDFDTVFMSTWSVTMMKGGVEVELINDTVTPRAKPYMGC